MLEAPLILPNVPNVQASRVSCTTDQFQCTQHVPIIVACIVNLVVVTYSPMAIGTLLLIEMFRILVAIVLAC